MKLLKSFPYLHFLLLSREYRAFSPTTTITSSSPSIITALPSTGTSSADNTNSTNNHNDIRIIRGGGGGQQQQQRKRQVHHHPLLSRLNKSTKWTVAAACTYGVWSRAPCHKGPFIITGSILSVYLTDRLKVWINQDRPDGAPFTDPGMPSSHSLVTFFLAVAWSRLVILKGSVSSSIGSVDPVSNYIVAAVLTGFASLVAWLRVACGYHSWEQIGVGAVLGSGLGLLWAELGSLLYQRSASVTARASWTLYLFGSMLFICKDMRGWVGRYKDI